MELLGGVYSLVKVLAMPLSEDRGGVGGQTTLTSFGGYDKGYVTKFGKPEVLDTLL